MPSIERATEALNRSPIIGKENNMATMTNRPVGADFGIYRILAGIVGKVAAWNDARMTRKILSSLSDRELDDLGLMRGDIEAVANGSYARR